MGVRRYTVMKRSNGCRQLLSPNNAVQSLALCTVEAVY